MNVIESRPAVARMHPILESDAKHVRLASLLQLVEIEMYTGRLSVDEAGFIMVRNGAVVGADADGIGGVEALNELFLHLEGRVRLELDETITGRPLAPTIALVMDGCRLIDEWLQLANERWAIAHAVQIDERLGAHLRAMRPALLAMDRGATLEQAVVEVGTRRALATESFGALIEAGVVVPAKGRPLALVPAPEPEPESTSAAEGLDVDANMDVDDLIAHARRLARANDIDRAERLLRAALERRPNDRVIAQNLRHLALRRTVAA